MEDSTDHNKGLKSGGLPASEPIAPRLGVDYPFPPFLEYVFLYSLTKTFVFLCNLSMYTL